MTAAEKTRQEVNNAIAEANREINLGFDSITEKPEPKYYEVVKEELNEMKWYGNNGKLPIGDIFVCENALPANMADVSYWLAPSHLPYSGLNFIALECCKEIDFSEYELKMNAKEATQ